MEKVLVILCVVLGLIMSVFLFPDGMGATLLCAVCAAIAVLIINRHEDEKEFLVQVFLLGLFFRMILAATIYTFDWGAFLGGDSRTYDQLGYTLLQVWHGDIPLHNEYAKRATTMSGSGWGMYYLVAAIYSIFGRNPLAAQMFSSVIGAATAPAAYICSYGIFHNKRVAKASALIVALFPSLILWSCQLLKDGFIIFLLILAMALVMRLQEKFDYTATILLILSLFAILTLRFYIFYMVVIAVIGSFVIGLSNSAQAIVRRAIVIMFIGLGLTYLGVMRNASTEIEQYGNLERIQQSRQNLAEAESGFGEDLDVSTTAGAIAAVPVGFLYLMLAPFPWQITNARQAITLPEQILWWCSIPLLFSGLWYTIKHRLRNAIAILIFTMMLTLAYSIFQGNVGTAYRQRAQIQVFLFIFIAAGWTLMQERRENTKRLHDFERDKMRRRLQVKV
jgi:small basic protein/4-amino-4-deoxy-L-arabinose transferase-like glycosyltransferase